MGAPTERNDAHSKFQAGILAQTALVMHQTVNLGRGPEWIQTLSEDQLQAASDKLYRASRRHEDKAVLPLFLPGLAVLVLAGFFFALMRFQHVALRPDDRIAILLICSILAIPVWMGLYDIRRRHRKVVAAAEQRWAEIIVELALRDAPAKRQREDRVDLDVSQ